MDKHPLLDSLKKDIEFYNNSIKEVALEITNANFSKYPIFIAHQHEVNLGEVILDKADYQREWTINATVLEDLIEHGIVEESKAADFKKVFKNPKEFICIFLITEKGGNFIFSPYKNKIKSK
ncbi:MAG: hypothetical protein HOD63_04100 [Bacteroidetes bacterium]|jgi:hypothetical protein|nr:hypothetical protein [Bacteroidota bacterium]MBT5529222.1 hypothetical protein [Cytophagia bacterium]MBT3424371.1 hypothetical protein [Bacteroidota bacterium]MBT3801528.1 hypothetical protein [Bacteroidota bacterium]MBT3932808.1 hypothetical protein [Bacteroidota bacterium]